MRREIILKDLRKHFVAVWIKNTNKILIATAINRTLHNVCAFVRKRVVYDDRRAFRLSVHHLNDSSCTRGEFLSKGTIGKIILVVGIIICRKNACTSQSVVMLLPKCSHPSILKLLRRIFSSVKPHSKRRGLLCCIGHKLVLAVPKFQGSPTRISSYTMGFHGQFAIPHLVLTIIVIFHVLEELIWRNKTNLYCSIFFLNVIAEPVRSVLAVIIGIIPKSTAVVASRPYIFHRNRNAALGNIGFYLIEDVCIVRQILVPIFVSIVCSGFVDGIDFAPVNPLPNTEMRQRIVCRRTPPKLCTMETFLACMSHQRRQSVGKAKAIRQHHIETASYAKLLLVESVGIEHAMKDAFGRRHHHIACVYRHSANVPLSVPNVVFHLFELRRIVFLHPHVLDGAFVVELEVRILCHQRHVVKERVLDVFRNGGLDSPVPLRVKMGIGDEEECLLFLCLANYCRAKEEGGSCDFADFHVRIISLKPCE